MILYNHLVNHTLNYLINIDIYFFKNNGSSFIEMFTLRRTKLLPSIKK